jgi:hypothetical protein
MPESLSCRLSRATRWTLVFASAAAALGLACGGSRGAVVSSAPSLPRTRAEVTDYRETSSHAHVVAFVEALTRLGRPIGTGSIGRTNEGREIPFLVVSRPLFGTPEAARRSGRPVVYVQGNIHGGEVEGKEALQALVRDLLVDPRPNVLDSIVLIAVPIYNADGNDRFGPQARNRGAQNGPEMIGLRPNAQDLDLNRDYMKLAAPETRASVAMFNTWDPHVFVDLHTTNGSYHGYALTYSPSLNPAAELAGVTFGGAWARDSFLPELRQRVRDRHQVETYPYGNFGRGGGAPTQWRTYEHVPRFGTNYYALRGRISVLSEAYSHDPFEKRVRATYAFTKELLSLVAERRVAVLDLARRSDAALGAGPAGIPGVPVRAQLTPSPFTADVVYEEIERLGDSTRYEAGMPLGARRTGRFRATPMRVFDRFTPTLTRPMPWGWAIAAGDTSALNLVRQHGVVVERLGAAWSGDAGPQFTVDSTIVAQRPFQDRRIVTLAGRWETGRAVSLAAGTWIVRSAQPLGVLAAYLLEPESDDGLVAWDVGGRSAGGPGTAPIIRLADPLPAPLDRSP